MKVAVTGVGGGVGQSIIKALQNEDHQLVGIDGNLLGTGLYGVPHEVVLSKGKLDALINV